jgi:hypothetical protein
MNSALSTITEFYLFFLKEKKSLSNQLENLFSLDCLHKKKRKEKKISAHLPIGTLSCVNILFISTMGAIQ